MPEHMTETARHRFPPRRQFHDPEIRAAVDRVFEHYSGRDLDFGSQGHFEELYCREFVSYLGGEGFCDAVCSGTAGLYVAIGALGLPPASRVLVSPITDPGTLSAILLNGHVPVPIDTAEGSYNIGPDQVSRGLESGAKALVAVHSAGEVIPRIDVIAEACRRRGVALVEDASQAHGAELCGRRTGTFGDIAVFSTMNTKTHSSGGTGGLVYTPSRELHARVRMLADRGKPFHESDFDPKNPGTFRLPALNLPLDELSCSIGLVTLSRLESVRRTRIALLRRLAGRLDMASVSCRLYPLEEGASPFFWPILYRSGRTGRTRDEFACELLAKGLPINPRYRYLVTDWAWEHGSLERTFDTPNARAILDGSFNLLFHEKFTWADMDAIAEAILETERSGVPARG